MLIIESKAANMDIIEYGIVCLSGRLEWYVIFEVWSALKVILIE